MRPGEGDPGYLWDMLEASREIQSFISGRSLNDLLEDRMLSLAVERDLEIIGEAASRVSADFRSAHPELPWRSVIAHRNVMAHDYGEIDLELVWVVASERIPELIELLEPLIPPLPED